MSNTEDNKGKFIPVLTEVLNPSEEKQERLFSFERDEEMLDSVQSGFHSSAPDFGHSQAWVNTGGVTSVNLDSVDELELNPSMLDGDWDEELDEPLPSEHVLQRPSQSKEPVREPFTRQEVKSEPMFNDSHQDKGEKVTLPEEEIFSPLSYNPSAMKDSLRPSDLMLVALTERISQKVRLGVKKNMEKHIQSTIFPLLDDFADRLVNSIEVDIQRMLREELAKATKEELKNLRQK